jgi:hypothetical protein
MRMCAQIRTQYICIYIQTFIYTHIYIGSEEAGEGEGEAAGIEIWEEGAGRSMGQRLTWEESLLLWFRCVHA